MIKKLSKDKLGSQWLGFMGFFGLLGFLRTFQGETQYIFFGFFGFFSYFFIGRIARETPDERMLYNYQRAKLSMMKFYSLILGILWTFVILNKNIFNIRYLSMELVELIVALVFALALILNAFLIYYYEKVE